MGTTSTVNGLPAPASGDANNIPADVAALVAVLDTGSVVKRLSQAQIDALTSAQKPAGLIVYNATAGTAQISNGSAFADLPRASDATPAAVTTGTATAGTALTAARGDHSHALPAHDHSTTAKGGAIPQASVTDLVAALAAAGPIGSGCEWYAAVAPTGWLLCDGSAVSRATYAALFAVLGTTWGAGDGSTTFNLPDRRARVGVGYKAGDADHGALAGVGGSKTSVAPHTHAIDHDHPAVTSGGESATHYHGVNAGPSAYSTTSYAAGADANLQVGALSIDTGTESATHTHQVDLPAFSGTSGAASAGATSGNLQPYVTVNYIIRAL